VRSTIKQEPPPTHYPGISIVFPHLLNEENDRILDLNLKMIKENTTCPYEVIFLASTFRPELVYTSLDWMMRVAKYDLILWHSTDVVLAHNWNENVLKCADHGDWIGLELIECGLIGVAPTNIKENFGTTAKDFQRDKFEHWVKEYAKDRPACREGFGWYSPSVWKKDWYIRTGGFPLEKPFPKSNDQEFKHRIEEKTTFIIANSYAYHFQRHKENFGLKEERE